MNNRKIGLKDFIISSFFPVSHQQRRVPVHWGVMGRRAHSKGTGIRRVNNSIHVGFSCSISKRFFFSKLDIAGRNFLFH